VAAVKLQFRNSNLKFVSRRCDARRRGFLLGLALGSAFWLVVLPLFYFALEALVKVLVCRL